jgi:hypothetical protein
MKDGKDAEISPTKKMMQVGRKPSMAMGGREIITTNTLTRPSMSLK